MKHSTLRIALVLSLLANAGVLGAVGYRLLAPDSAPATVNLPRHLQLSAEQQRQWHASEEDFLERLEAAGNDIHQHRDRLIHAIFADTPDPALIATERATIARLQDEQQQLVIRQLLAERELLEPAQRERLRRLLLTQPVGPSVIEQMHRD